MADRKISDLTPLTAPAAGDYLPIVDISEAAASSKNKRITIEELMRGAPDGTAGAPGFAFESDPNSGIYSPGADQVAISTGGTGRLFVDASGNVGIADATPQRDVGTTSLAIGDGSKSASIDLYGTVKNYAIYNGGAGQLGFFDLSASTERITLTSAGLVGVGTSSPDANSQLHIVGSSYQPLYVNTTGVGGGGATFFRSGTQALYVGTAGSSWLSGSSTADGLVRAEANLVLATNGNSRAVTIDTSQRVGIGTTSNRDSTKLDVLGDITFGANASYYGTLGYSAGTGHLEFTSSDGGFKWIRRSGPATSMVLDSSGRLLVGTSTARSNLPFAFSNTAARFQVEGAAEGQGAFAVIQNYDSATTSVPAVFNLARSGATSIGSNTIVASGNRLGEVQFSGSDGTNFIQAAVIRGEVDGTPGANDMPGRLVFSTTADGASSPTERMRITSNGTMSVFASTDDAIIGATGSAAGSVSTVFGLNHSATSTTTGTTCLYVFTNGDVRNTNNSYGAISDIKLKENIVDANSQWDDIKALQVRKYNFKQETGHQTHAQIGLVAQEVELVSPGLVSESPDRDAEGNDLGTVTKSVNYSVLYMKAVKALQEAMERIETLEVKVAALESA